MKARFLQIESGFGDYIRSFFFYNERDVSCIYKRIFAAVNFEWKITEPEGKSAGLGYWFKSIVGLIFKQKGFH